MEAVVSTPPNDRSRYAALYDWAGIQIFNLVRDRFHPDLTEVLDVGAGWGKYKYLLPDYTKMDACEIWEPNAKQIKDLYRKVFVMDICDLLFDFYHVVIMGDVLEHIELERAQKLIRRTIEHCDELYVVIPYQYPQGSEDGNVHEAHLQDFLTPYLMQEYYPELELLTDNGQKGIYIKA